MKVSRLSVGTKAADAWNAANHELPVAAKSARAPALGDRSHPQVTRVGRVARKPCAGGKGNL